MSSKQFQRRLSVWRHSGWQVCVCALWWYSSTSAKPFCGDGKTTSLHVTVPFLCSLSLSVDQFSSFQRNLACRVLISHTIAPYGHTAYASVHENIHVHIDTHWTYTASVNLLRNPERSDIEPYSRVFPYQKVFKWNFSIILEEPEEQIIRTDKW